MEDINFHLSENMLKVAYLFMRSEGEVPNEKLEIFDKMVIKGVDLSCGKPGIIEQCEKLLQENGIVSAVKTVIQSGGFESSHLPFAIMHKGYCSHSDQRLFLWALINIGFLDGKYTPIESHIVKLVAEAMKIDKSYVLELEDTAKALVANETKKSALLPYCKSSEESDAIQKQIEEENKVLAQFVEDFVSSK